VNLFFKYNYINKEKIILLPYQVEQFEKDQKNFFDLKWFLDQAWKLGVSQKDYKKIITNREQAFSVLWNIAENRLEEPFTIQRIGLVSSTRLIMANMLRYIGDLETALKYYLLVAALTIQGETPYESQLRNGYGEESSWDLSIYFPPSLGRSILDLMQLLRLGHEVLRAWFYETYNYESIILNDLDFDLAWSELIKLI
jgi:hypothetical protein